MSTQALVEGFRGSSQDPGVTVHFDQVWFDQLSLEALLVDGNIVRYRARSHDGVQSWLVGVAARDVSHAGESAPGRYTDRVQRFDR